MIDKFFDYDSIEINGGLIMPRIVVTTLYSDAEIVINETEKIAKKVFGMNGVLPMVEGAVEIIPNRVDTVLRERIVIDIFLHEGERRTSKILAEIAKIFGEMSISIAVNINPSPKELWRLI